MADPQQSQETIPYESTIITITLADGKEFTAHKAIICKASPFFEKCLNSGLAESSSNAVSLPEDDSTAFGVILDWSYGRLAGQSNEYNKSYEKMAELVAAHVLADKYCMESACNDLMDMIKDHCKKTITPPEWLIGRGGQPLGEGPLRTFLVELLAWELLHHNSIMLERYAKPLLLDGGDNAWEVVSMILSKKANLPGKLTTPARFEKWDDPSGRPNCQYHVHKETAACNSGDASGSPPS